MFLGRALPQSIQLASFNLTVIPSNNADAARLKSLSTWVCQSVFRVSSQRTYFLTQNAAVWYCDILRIPG